MKRREEARSSLPEDHEREKKRPVLASLRTMKRRGKRPVLASLRNKL